MACDSLQFILNNKYTAGSDYLLNLPLFVIKSKIFFIKYVLSCELVISLNDKTLLNGIEPS